MAKAKSQFYQAGLNIMGYICNTDSRHLDISKVLKILNQLECTDIISTCAFIGVYIYYQIQIKDFAYVAPFLWKKGYVEVIDLFKLALITLLALVSLDYNERASDIILAVDASFEGWGGVLIQLVQGKRHLSRYESGIWSSVEKRYNTTKQKC